MDFSTQVIHAGVDRDPATGASSVPIYLSSTFARETLDAPRAFDYTRSGNPTRAALELAIAEWEAGADGVAGGAAGFAFASGMAAIASVLLLFAPGDHLVVGEDVYGGTYRVLTGLFARWGLKVTFVDATDPEKIRAAVTENTRALFVETPSNPTLRITDLAAVAALARERNLLTVADNTFATPFGQRPLAYGFDYVVHSATKFLNGHCDVLAGLAVARTAECAERLKYVQNAFGAVLGAQDSWLLLRGMKTLAVRMAAQQRTAEILARRLSGHRAVKKVYYPTLENHPGRAVHARQATGGGAVVSFELESETALRRMTASLRLPLIAVSLGGVESILTHPATMSHAAMPADERERRGITNALARLSAGLESVEDLWSDLRRALDASGA